MKCQCSQASRLSRAVALALATSGVCAGETVCMNRDVGNAVTVYRAQAIATQILKAAGVQIEFKDDVRACVALRRAIVITVSDQALPTDHPGSLAYAMVYERTQIVVFYDRVLASFRPAGVPSLLGHVLAHEIGHILQGVEHHSATGVMKEKWDHRDYVEMQRQPLRFTDEDLLLIQQGLKNRADSRVPD